MLEIEFADKKKSFISGQRWWACIKDAAVGATRRNKLEEDEFMRSKLDTRVDDPSKYIKANHNCLINDDEVKIEVQRTSRFILWKKKKQKKEQTKTKTTTTRRLWIFLGNLQCISWI